jgi:hypothetical protein
MAGTEHTSLVDLDAHRKAPPAYLTDEYIQKAPHGHGLTLKLLKTVQRGIHEISGHLRMSDAELARVTRARLRDELADHKQAECRHKQALEAAGFLRATTQAPKVPQVNLRLDWNGEFLTGTQAALQALGIGAGQDFPSDRRWRRGLVTTDPRGLPCKITNGYTNDEGAPVFWARITYPGRNTESPWLQHAPGVRKNRRDYGDVYSGKAEALIAAGLVSTEQLPGAPGLPKTCARFMPDGSFVRLKNQPLHRAPVAGEKSITKYGERFEVLFWAAPDEAAQRKAEAEATTAAWAQQPRPVSLLDLAAANAMRTNGSEAKRPRLTLVLSPCAQQPMGAAGVKAQSGA